MPQIKDVSITKTTADDDDLLIMQNPTTGETYNITKANLLQRLSSGSVTPPVASEVSLTFSSNGDNKGVLYYLGTTGNTRPWVNPVSKGVEVSCSGIGSGTTESLVDRQPSHFYTQNASNSWIKVNLFSKLKCNYYSLRNRADPDHYLRNWKLQGSNDDTNWIELDTQDNNYSLNTESQWLSLPVANNQVGYNLFRLIQTGANSAGYSYLCLGEIELYGAYSP